MKRANSWIGLILTLALTAVARAQSPAPAPAPAPTQLAPGDYVAVIGDSITEQRIYSVNIEAYLLLCQPAANLQLTQFGWSGDTANGFAARMANDCLPFKPTVATTCYGMNDGGYAAMTPERGQRYRETMINIVKQMRAAGVRFIILGSPGAVDFTTYKRGGGAEVYNPTLAAFRDIAREVAQAEGVSFADVHGAMIDAMTKAKAKYGPDYHVCGGDGVHPARNGHLVMAYAFLKAMGCDGNIGAITLDAAATQGDATPGHKVLSYKDGVAEIESTRYPFCFSGDPADPNSTTGIIEFIPFNQDLNRFLFIVKGLPATGKTTVTWSTPKKEGSNVVVEVSKEFANSDLATGINLAAEFLDNPFRKPFATVEQKILEQQTQETLIVKSLLHNLPQYVQLVPDEKASFDRVAAALIAKDAEFRTASAAAVQPVRHLIKLTPVAPQ